MEHPAQLRFRPIPLSAKLSHFFQTATSPMMAPSRPLQIVMIVPMIFAHESTVSRLSRRSLRIEVRIIASGVSAWRNSQRACQSTQSASRSFRPECLMCFLIRSHVYHPAFAGSYSLKCVLLALVPEMSYEGMQVADGQSAGLVWVSIVGGKFEDSEQDKVRKALARTLRTGHVCDGQTDRERRACFYLVWRRAHRPLRRKDYDCSFATTIEPTVVMPT
jgi:hypothetical protein